ncbi:hypothetical protein C8F04DRAFT_1277542 [Mycena alexandri]|uniref:Uncharacterized protein n=1 Tax=Mycena alexandri TaxID=1745969 RepID=A0AAD6S148_9AGAR|nr:hypothetical protein C8F04DRAFT_1277542 [Mycena alexandri]
MPTLLSIIIWIWSKTADIESQSSSTLLRASGVGYKTVTGIQSRSGVFLPNDAVHTAVFYWLWVPIIQEGLDTYRTYWNNHKILKSAKKVNVNGSCPNNMFLNPTSIDILAKQCYINVNPDTVNELREAYGGEEARSKAYWWVSEEFKFNADVIYENLGAPEPSLAKGWNVFKVMVAKIEELRAAGTDIGLDA